MQWQLLGFRLSLPALFIVTVTMILLSFHAGAWFGRWKSRQPDPEPQLPTRMMVTSTLSLLAFMMGFGFGLASSHSDSRDQALGDEAIAIGIAYRRADLLSEPARTNVRNSLLEYVDLRMKSANATNVEEAIAQLRHLQTRIWHQALAAGQNNGGTPAPPNLLVQSLNDIIDVHSERVLANLRSRIPRTVWSVLYLITILAIAAAGYHHGLCGGRNSIAAIAYALIFALVIAMIADLDTPNVGRFNVSPQAFIDLRARLDSQ